MISVYLLLDLTQNGLMTDLGLTATTTNIVRI